jgi:hypothetical protein
MATLCGMPRPLRIEYEGVLYHLMSRGHRNSKSKRDANRNPHGDADPASGHADV